MSKPLPPPSPGASPLDDPQVRSGPFWGELRVFLAVAKAKSFNRAAEALKMSQPTVSRQVRRLQDVMGAQLVVPTQSGITLTRQGEELARSLHDLDQKLFEISHDLNAETRNAEGTVRLAGSEVLAGLFIVPALLAFNEMYPKIRLQICTPLNRTEFRANHADVMISVQPIEQPDVVSRRLGYLHLLPFAGQPYIARYGVPTRSNLSSHCFLDCDAHSHGAVWQSWRDLTKQGLVTHTCDNLITYSLMIRYGLGIGLGATCALADPQVVPLELGVHLCAPIGIHAPADRISIKAVQVVFDWLSEMFDPAVSWFSQELRLEYLPRDVLAPMVSRFLGNSTPDP